MLSNTYHIDWVFIDTIIIIFLFLLLIGVKIFKSTHRWRLRFSNEALEDFPCTNPFYSDNNYHFKVKNCNLVRNSSLHNQYDKNPLIILIRTNFKRHLAKIITEGLCSYGFNVINLKLSYNRDSHVNIFSNKANKELKSLISSNIKNFKDQGLIWNSKYLLINISRTLIPDKEIIFNSNEIGYIFINPRVKKDKKVNSTRFHYDSLKNPQLFYIFCKRNFLYFRNSDFKYMYKEIDQKLTTFTNLIILEKSTKSFKYYETILLGIIIDIIENKLVRSENST